MMKSKKLISLVISTLLVIAIFPSSAFADEAASFVGLATNVKKAASSKLEDTITVNSSGQTAAILQLKSPKDGTWIDKKTYPLDLDGETTIKLQYPSEWKKSTQTFWRVYLPLTETSAEVVSPEVKVFTKNIKNLPMSAKGATIFCLDDNQILYDKSMNTQRANASTTKIMTATIALEKYNPGSKVKISKKAAYTPWGSLYMRPGDKYYMNDLMHALLIESSNDASVAVGEHVAGSTGSFVKKMNGRAKSLGLKNTQFKNTHGLDASGHYSSPYDLAIMMKNALRYNEFRSIIKKEKYTVKNTSKSRSKRIETTNQMLKAYDACIGGKTGTETNSGYCFVGVYNSHGKEFIAVTLGSNCNSNRWKDSKQLYNYIKAYGGY